MMKKIILILAVLFFGGVSFAVVNPLYPFAKEYIQQRILFLENRKIELENLITWLIMIHAPQYLIDQRQAELDAVNAELEYLYNIEYLE